MEISKYRSIDRSKGRSLDKWLYIDRLTDTVSLSVGIGKLLPNRWDFCLQFL